MQNLIILFSHRHSIFKHIFSHSILYKSGIETNIARPRKPDLRSAIRCSKQSSLVTSHQSILADWSTNTPVGIRALREWANVSCRSITNDLVLTCSFEHVLNLHSVKHLPNTFTVFFIYVM